MTNLYELSLYSFQFIFWTATQHVRMQSLGRLAPQAWYIAYNFIKACASYNCRIAIGVNA